MGRTMKRLAALGIMLLACAAGSVKAEISVSASTESARTGESVDILVEAGDGAATVTYTLTRDGNAVFSGKEDTHFRAAFRPREEGTYLLEARVAYEDGRTETGKTQIPVSGTAEQPQGPDVIYSQKDGSWKDKAYGKSELDNAGCAIFTLSHALQRMGWTGEDIEPAKLAETYRKCYTKNGTANARLIYQASLVYGYTINNNLIKQAAQLKEGLENGDLYSFGIVNGHIALMDGIDSGAQKVRIVDSAPSATFERIRKGSIFYLRDGEYIEATDPGEIPGARYYFESGYYGGMSYYMDLSYCARRGGRLIRPTWLYYNGPEGKIGATPVEIGIGESRIIVNGREITAATRDLRWGDGEKPRLAIVTEKKNIRLNSEAGTRVGTAAPCRILPVLREEEDRVYVIDEETRGFVLKSQVELAEAPDGDITKGIISVNGSTSGRAQVKLRFGPSEKQKVMATWKTGTEVTVLGWQDDFWQVEAKGLRLWVHKDFLTTDAAIPEPAAPEEGTQEKEQN